MRNALTFLGLCLVACSGALGGSPLDVCDAGTSTPFTWQVPVGGAANAFYNVESGPLNATTNNAAGTAKVASAFGVWEAVASASITYTAGPGLVDLGVAGPDPGFACTGAGTPIDVDQTNFFCVFGISDGQSPVIFDDDGALFSFLGFPPGVLGFAGIEFTVSSPDCAIVEGFAVLNGPSFVADPLLGDDLLVHEFGHFTNLAHTVVNGENRLFGDETGPTPNNLFGAVPDGFTATMYPFAGADSPGEISTLQSDDIAIISTLYPDAGFPGTFATITGDVLDSFATSGLTGVNVIARSTANPFEDAVSAISGDFTQGNGPNGLNDGLYTLNGLTPGADYVVYIDEILGGGFSTPLLANPAGPSPVVGPFPGPEETYNGASESSDPVTDVPGDPFALTLAAAVTPGIDIIVNGESNEPDDSFADATAIGCPSFGGTFSIAPLGDVDFYLLSGTPGSTIDIDIDADELGSTLDSLLGVFDSAMISLGVSDDDPAPTEPFTLDSFLSVTLPADGLLFIATASFDDLDFDGGADAFTTGPYTITVTCTSPPATVCGDSMITPPETCDPPGVPAGQPDECRLDCTFCGDGFTDPDTRVELLTNGDFETGMLAPWVVTDLAGGSGTFILDTPGAILPTSGNPTAANAAGGAFYAVTDQSGIGTHVLSQAFTVPAGATKVEVAFQMFVNDWSGSGGIVDPIGLDHTGPANQHARVDIMDVAATPFDTGAGVVANLFIGVDPGAPPNAYTSYSLDITGSVAPGGTYVLRFGEVDNQFFLNQGVDNVSVTAEFAGTAEECDDGNNLPGDGCSPDCLIESLCGNGNLDPGEGCDDGNNANGDGCSSTCAIETFVQGDLMGSTGSIGATLIDIDRATGAGAARAPHGSLGSVSEIEFRADGLLVGATGGGASNLIEIDPITGAETLRCTHTLGALNGLEFVNNTLYATYVASGGGGNPSELVIVGDPVAGVCSLTSVGLTGFNNIGGLAWDPTSSTLYGCTSGPAGGDLLTCNLGTGACAAVGATGFTECSALEFSPDGELFGGLGGNDASAGSLVRINPATGAGVLVGPTSFPVLSGLAVVPGPDDTFGTATDIDCPAFGGNFEIAPLGDVDYFRLSGSPGQGVTIDIDASETGSPLDPALGVFDSAMMSLGVSDDDPAPGEPFTLDSFLQVTMPASGEMFIAVSSFADFEFDGGANAFTQGPYMLSVTCGAQPPGSLMGSTGTSGASLILIDEALGVGTFVAPHGTFGSVTELEFRADGLLIGATGGGSNSLVEIDPMTGAETLRCTHTFGALNGLEFVNNTLYGTFIPGGGGGNPSELVIVGDPAGGVCSLTPVGPTGFNNIGGLAFDAVSGTMYGCTSGGGLTDVELLRNGDFEAGALVPWVATDLGTGTFITSAPGTPVPSTGNPTSPNPAGGSSYAVTDQTGPGTHALEQTFTVPPLATNVTLEFEMFVNDWSGSGGIVDPIGLDHTGPANQHARVDILATGSPPFDTGAGVLGNFYIGVDLLANPNPYTSYSFNITGIVPPGGSYIVRFAEVDNQLFLNQGVDNVRVTATVPLGGNLVTCDLGSGGCTLVGPTGFDQCSGLEFATHGTLYGGIGGSSPDAGNLITIDPATGIGLVVGPTGFPIVSGLAFVPFPTDPDGDGIINAKDDCPLTPHTGLGPAPFAGRIHATTIGTFQWTTPQDADWLRGTLILGTPYVVDGTGTISAATSLVAPEVPPIDTTFFWLLKPDCPSSSWTGGGMQECPASAGGPCLTGGRDGNLPFF